MGSSDLLASAGCLKDPWRYPPNARSWVLRWGVLWNGAESVAHPWGPYHRFCGRCGCPQTAEPAADSAFAAAIAGLCQHSTPYHLAHGLLDYAGYLSRLDGDEAAGAIIGEARDIAGCLRCQPAAGSRC